MKSAADTEPYLILVREMLPWDGDLPAIGEKGFRRFESGNMF